MDVYDNGVATQSYTEQDHDTWNKLCVRQFELVRDVACREFHEGLPRLNLDFTRLPDRDVMSGVIERQSGWTLANAQNEYLGATEWFEHLQHRRFPVTDYIRKPDELDFTPLPDLFHEYFGHLAFFTDRRFGDLAQYFGEVYMKAHTEEQQTGVARIWWYTTEFGFLRENGELKVFGAGLLSSPGELLHSLKPETPKHAFDPQRVAATPSAVYNFHSEYFYLDTMADIRTVLDAYARSEGFLD